jgi:uncharacterized protein (DUF1800 family)
MPLPEFTGTLGIKRAAHLLRRATFGATRAETDAFAALTPAQAIQQLYRQSVPDAPPPVDPDTGITWVNTEITDFDKESTYVKYFKLWFIGQMLGAGIPPSSRLAYTAREKIVFFLHTHFPAITNERVFSSQALYFQNQLFRLYARDAVGSPIVPESKLNFRELIKKISVDNAMLLLLDGRLNVNGSPNENYARELFELYSIGRGLEGSLPPPSGPGDYIFFTEHDVQQAARVLSGWNFDYSFSVTDADTLLPRGVVRGSALNASAHDNGVKIFSSRFINPATGQPYVIQPDPLLLHNGNATEASAMDEISQLINMIFAQEETARHICRKLYRFFVYHEIDTTIEDNVISVMAETFRNSNFKIQVVIENLLRSQHFYDATPGATDDKYGSMIKSPLEYISGAIRFFHLSLPDMQTNPTAFYQVTAEIHDAIVSQGLPFYEPFDVAGYDAYHQYPVYNRSWITVNYLANRYAFIQKLLSPDSADPLSVNVYQFVRNHINPAVAANARNLVLELVRYLFPWADNLTFDQQADDTATITAERLNYFLTAFLSDIDPDPESAWTYRWTQEVGIGTMTSQLQALFNALMQSPEYQLQ